MYDQEAKLRKQLPERKCSILDRLHAVVEVKGLPPSIALAPERESDKLLVVLADVRADRATPFGRRLDHADVTEPREGHVERARDGRRRQREHVDFEAELAQELLLRDAEALLLVEDNQAEVLRSDVA